MFPWMDFLIAGVVVWEIAAGYIYGIRKACVRICVFVGSGLISLLAASNCATYLRPLLEPVFRASIEEKVVAASTGQIDLNLGLWQSLLDIPSGPGGNYIHNLLSLSINVSGTCFLILVILLVFKLIESKERSGSGWAGALTGFLGGLVTAWTGLAVVPVLALAGSGSLLVSALQGSWLASFFQPIVEKIIRFMALFVL